jgi:hypothetical protein
LLTVFCLSNILVKYSESLLFHRKIAENGFFVNDKTLLANVIKTVGNHRQNLAFGVGGAVATDEGFDKLKRLARSVNQHVRVVEIINSICDEAPEEYKDPITLELLTDPVWLPGDGKAGNAIQRSTFRSLRLNGNIDPFTKSELPIESEMKDMPELKAEIENWFEEQKAIKLSMMEPNDVDGNAMDFST